MIMKACCQHNGTLSGNKSCCSSPLVQLPIHLLIRMHSPTLYRRSMVTTRGYLTPFLLPLFCPLYCLSHALSLALFLVLFLVLSLASLSCYLTTWDLKTPSYKCLSARVGTQMTARDENQTNHKKVTIWRALQIDRLQIKRPLKSWKVKASMTGKMNVCSYL